jgi:hypothetical protein
MRSFAAATRSAAFAALARFDAYPYDYPCVVSHGHGMRFFYRAWRAAATCPPGPYRAARYMDDRQK